MPDTLSLKQVGTIEVKEMPDALLFGEFTLLLESEYRNQQSFEGMVIHFPESRLFKLRMHQKHYPC